MNRLLLICALLCWAVPGAAEVSCGAGTHADDSYAATATRFHLDGRVYLKLFCQGLPDSGVLTVDWISQRGRTARQDLVDFSGADPRGLTIMRWFKLQRRGPLESMVSGDEYDPRDAGHWQARVSYNGGVVAKCDFHLY